MIHLSKPSLTQASVPSLLHSEVKMALVSVLSQLGDSSVTAPIPAALSLVAEVWLSFGVRTLYEEGNYGVLGCCVGGVDPVP
jgi:hypothetical protein